MTTPALTAKERQAYELERRGMTQKNIGLALGVSRTAIESRLVNARRKLAAAKEAA